MGVLVVVKGKIVDVQHPSSNKFYGDVDYLPCDASDPGTSYSLPLEPIAPTTPASPYVSQSYPNPFNPRTTIDYGVSEPGTRVRIVVYDIGGRAVTLSRPVMLSARI